MRRITENGGAENKKREGAESAKTPPSPFALTPSLASLPPAAPAPASPAAEPADHASLTENWIDIGRRWHRESRRPADWIVLPPFAPTLALEVFSNDVGDGTLAGQLSV